MKKIEDPWRQHSSLPLCVFGCLFFSFFLSNPHPHCLCLPLSPPSPSHAPSFLIRLTPLEGGGVAVALFVHYLREGEAHLMTPHEQWLLKPNKCRHSTSFSLTRFSFLVQLSSLFRLPPSDTPSAAISASALHLFAQLLCSFFPIFHTQTRALWVFH